MLYYYGARYYNPRESIFLSVDQLSEKTMTPYQYTYQNPIKYIDPTGMEAEGADDIFEVYKNGDIKQIEQEGEDVVVMMNDKNERTDKKVNIGNDATLKKSMTKSGKKYNVLTIKDQDKAKKAFKAIAENSDVEFALINYETSKGELNSKLLTNEKKSSVNGSGFAKTLEKKGNTVTEINHNHPSSNLPSGYDRYTGNIRSGNPTGDAKGVTQYPTNRKGNDIKRGVYRPLFLNKINRYDKTKVFPAVDY